MLYLESPPQVTSLTTKFMHERGGVPQLDKYRSFFVSRCSCLESCPFFVTTSLPAGLHLVSHRSWLCDHLFSPQGYLPAYWQVSVTPDWGKPHSPVIYWHTAAPTVYLPTRSHRTPPGSSWNCSQVPRQVPLQWKDTHAHTQRNTTAPRRHTNRAAHRPPLPPPPPPPPPPEPPADGGGRRRSIPWRHGGVTSALGTADGQLAQPRAVRRPYPRHGVFLRFAGTRQSWPPDDVISQIYDVTVPWSHMTK